MREMWPRGTPLGIIEEPEISMKPHEQEPLTDSFTPTHRLRSKCSFPIFANFINVLKTSFGDINFISSLNFLVQWNLKESMGALTKRNVSVFIPLSLVHETTFSGTEASQRKMALIGRSNESGSVNITISLMIRRIRFTRDSKGSI